MHASGPSRALHHIGAPYPFVLEVALINLSAQRTLLVVDKRTIIAIARKQVNKKSNGIP